MAARQPNCTSPNIEGHKTEINKTFFSETHPVGLHRFKDYFEVSIRVRKHVSERLQGVMSFNVSSTISLNTKPGYKKCVFFSVSSFCRPPSVYPSPCACPFSSLIPACPCLKVLAAPEDA